MRSWELAAGKPGAGPASSGAQRTREPSAARARHRWGGFSQRLGNVISRSPSKPQSSLCAKQAMLGRSAGKAVGLKLLRRQLPDVQSTLAFGLSGSWSFVAHGDVQAEAGGVQVPGLSPQAGLGGSRQAGRQAGGAAACFRQSHKSRRAAFCESE